MAICAFVRPGDEVILFEPTYDSYAPAVEVNGGKPVFVRLRWVVAAMTSQQEQKATSLIVLAQQGDTVGARGTADDAGGGCEAVRAQSARRRAVAG